MTQYVGVGGAHKTIIKQWVGVGGAWKQVIKRWVGVGGVWKVVYTLMHSVSAGGFNGLAPSGQPASDTSTANVSGGVGPFTYQWSVESGIGVTLSNTTSSVCTASRTMTNVGVAEGTIRCTVTDTGNGNAQAYDIVTYYFENY